MDGFFGHCEIPSKQFLALFFGEGRAVFIHPFSVETPKTAIARGPITGRTDVWLSTLWPTLAELNNGDAAIVRPTVPGSFFEDSRVEVCHGRYLVFLITRPLYASFKECAFT